MKKLEKLGAFTYLWFKF